eukprot:4935140-Amphidinium_carterae.5
MPLAAALSVRSTPSSWQRQSQSRASSAINRLPACTHPYHSASPLDKLTGICVVLDTETK